jgi:integrase
MRRGELLGLRWEHVHLAKRIVHLPLTKNGESRDVPLSRRATDTLTALSKHKQPNIDLVFPMTGNSVRLAFERLRARAKMSNFHFHDLRHEAISCGSAAERRHSYIEGSGPGYSCGFAATLTGVRTATSYGSHRRADHDQEDHAIESTDEWLRITPRCSAHHSHRLRERSCSRTRCNSLRCDSGKSVWC